MEEIAGWIAPAATMVAAMMTAANLGARFTGWGFVVFTVGSIGWSLVAVATGQSNLLWTNLFLTLVNLVGVWRWLGRKAKLDDGARAASVKSEAAPQPSLFAVSAVEGKPVLGSDGVIIGQVIGAMAECRSGRIAYLVVAEGGVAGVGQRLHALAWNDVEACDDGFRTLLDAGEIARLREVPADDWPARAP